MWSVSTDAPRRLDADPLTVAPEKIRDIRVMKTIKRGSTIYTRAQQRTQQAKALEV